MLELHDLLAQAVHAFGDGRVAAEDLLLDLLFVDDQSVHHGGVGIDDRIEQTVSDRLGAEAEEVVVGEQRAFGAVRILGIPLVEVRAIGPVDPTLVLADHRHSIRSNDDVELVEGDFFRFVHVSRRANDEEEILTVAFQLRPLPRVEQVLTEDRMQVPDVSQLVDGVGSGAGIEEEGHPTRMLREAQSVRDSGIVRSAGGKAPVDIASEPLRRGDRGRIAAPPGTFGASRE